MRHLGQRAVTTQGFIARLRACAMYLPTPGAFHPTEIWIARCAGAPLMRASSLASWARIGPVTLIDDGTNLSWPQALAEERAACTTKCRASE